MIDWKNFLNNANVQVNIGSSVNNLKSDPRFKPLSDLAEAAPALLDSLSQFAGVLNPGQTYTIRYPAGLPHNLMRLSGGGFSTTIVAPGTNNDILGSAALIPTGPAPMMRLMAAASQQYFLTEISDHLASLNEKTDKILQILEVDKRAELAAENTFVQSIVTNFDSIMASPEHRIATLTNLQQTKKIAAQHIDFYLFRLRENNEKISTAGGLTESQAHQRFDEFERESAYCDAALRLYFTCSTLEIHLSGNYNSSYIRYVASEVAARSANVHDTLTAYSAVLQATIKQIRPDGFALPGAKIGSARQFLSILDAYALRDSELNASAFEKQVLAIENEQNRMIECVVCPDGQAYVKSI